jgi:hypothetical protein
VSGGGKRYHAASKLVDREREYVPAEAIKALKEFPDAKFDETVELAFRLGIDPRKADQMVRGTVSLPNGTGKSVRVAVFAQGPKATEAKEAGADVVGAEDLVEQVMAGNIDFEAAVATGHDGRGRQGRPGARPARAHAGTRRREPSPTTSPRPSPTSRAARSSTRPTAPATSTRSSARSRSRSSSCSRTTSPSWTRSSGRDPRRPRASTW